MHFTRRFSDKADRTKLARLDCRALFLLVPQKAEVHMIMSMDERCHCVFVVYVMSDKHSNDVYTEEGIRVCVLPRASR